MPGASLDVDQQLFVVSQSWLQSFMRCPESARWELLHPSDTRNDALTIGTATHVFMEHRLDGASYEGALASAVEWLDNEVDQPNFVFVKVKTRDTMLNHLRACVAGFERHIIPQVAPGGYAETTLSFPLRELDDGWAIYLTGTPDYLDIFGRVWDWKTAASEYNAWEAAQWAIQPTAYTYLASKALNADITEFTYAVAVKPQGYIQLIDLERRQPDWDWLARVASGALTLARHHLHDEWPVNHNHYLCSPRWCPHWDTCRGMYAADPQLETTQEGVA